MAGPSVSWLVASAVIGRILRHLGLPTVLPVARPARAPPLLARGIHFFSVGASVRSQFEFVQQILSSTPGADQTVTEYPSAGVQARRGFGSKGISSVRPWSAAARPTG